MKTKFTSEERIFINDSIRFVIVLLLFFAIQGSYAQYINEASGNGISHIYMNPGFGAGLSMADMNGDGLDDLTLATSTGQAIQIFVQTQEGLELLLEPSLIGITDPIRSINWVDYDNDGDKDLFITTAEPLSSGFGFRLLQQDEEGNFEDVTLESGIDPEFPFSYGSSWADYDRDGHLDLYVSTYERGPTGSNHMYHNLGDGTFEDVTGELGLMDLQGISFTSVFFDADLDGVLDLFTANDRGDSYNTFYRGNPDGTFTDISVESNLYIDMDAMGVEVGDYDADGDFDIYVTNTYGGASDILKGNILFRNDGELQFTAFGNFPFGVDIGFFWGCSFLDNDYDRDLDLFTVAAWRDFNQYSGLYLFENLGEGLYTSYSGVEFDYDSDMHFGSAQGDLNDDGWTDIGVLDAYIGNSQVWMATPSNNNWVKLHLEGTISNREAIGSLIEVWVNGQKRIDYTGCGNSFASQDSDTYPFGLGSAIQADSVIIHWPNGHVNVAYNLQAGERYVLVEDVNSYVLDLNTDCNSTLPSPVGLENSFNPVEGVQDRIQLYWFKELPDERYSEEDAAACDIKYWPIYELDPVTADPIGKPLLDPDTLLIPNAKKFHPDGSPRGIYKWPVKFKAEGANNSRRIDPNTKYEWQLRCACGHGEGPESEWSAISTFDTPDYDIQTGIYQGIPSDDESSFKLLSAQGPMIKISPNPVRGRELTVFLTGAAQGPVNYSIIDLMGREIIRGQSFLGKEFRLAIPLPESLGPWTYLLELRTRSMVLSNRFIVSKN